MLYKFDGRQPKVGKESYVSEKMNQSIPPGVVAAGSPARVVR